MSKALTDAIHALTDVAAAQLNELRVANEERRQARWRDPAFLAEIEADRAPLHRLRASRVLNVPALAAPFTKTIPSDYWTIVDGDIQVSCTCGETPSLQPGVPQVCSCERAFLFTGKAVRIAVFEDDPDTEAPVD